MAEVGEHVGFGIFIGGKMIKNKYTAKVNGFLRKMKKKGSKRS